MKRTFKRNVLCAAVLLTVLQGGSVVNAQINECPLPDKVYDEYLYYDNGGSKNVSIQGSIEGKTQNYYFNQGATIDASNGGLHATILSHNWGKYNNSTYDIFNIGKDKEFKILQYSGYTNLEAQEGANLVINGGNIILESGCKSSNIDNTNAAIHMEDAGKIYIDSESLYIGNKRLEDKIHNVGAISVAGDSNLVDIDLTGRFVADNVDMGIAAQDVSGSATQVSVNAGKDIIINSFRSDGKASSGYRGAGIYSMAYHDENGKSKIDLTSREGNINIKAQGYAYYGWGNTKADFIAKNGDVNLVSAEKHGIYAYNKVDNKDNTVNIEGRNVNISGKQYGAYLYHSTFTSSADTTYLTADNGWSICLFGNSVADVTSVNNIVSGDIYAEDSKILLKGNNNQVEGQVRMLEGSTIYFASKEGTNIGLTAIYSDGYDAVIGEAEDGKVSTVDFKQSSIVNAYEKVNGEYVTGYTNTPDKSAGTAILAKRNSVINMSDAANSYAIYGDVVAGRGYDGSSVGGKVNIGGIGTVICGDVLAMNTGTVNIDISNGFIEGRIDSYDDMATSEHDSRPSEINKVPLKEAGNITLKLNDSAWKARYQSWVTELDLNNSVVDLTSDGASSIVMNKLSGNGEFNMNLNSEDHSKGDMLYIGEGSGKHTVNIVGGITGGYENISKENPLRFATVKNSGGEFVVADTKFGAITKDAGIYDLEYSVEKIDFDKNDAENEKYNGNGYKPDNNFVENVLDADDTAENWVITGVNKKETSNAGQTIIDMSRANYRNAVYLDRLNKRLGEARFIDGDEGMWVRMRHDRIGMKDAFRSSNTMYQLGYDKLHKQYDNGERHVGAAIDYLDGETSYSKVGGTGEISRLGFWMYDTWLGNKGHYADYVAKFGHMSNDFDIKSFVTGESITGEYDNNLFSVSAEFGRKKDIGNDWYVEPQVQLQLARITDAAYATTQGTDVYVDAINSLIARAGFRMGKDVAKDSTIYFKADVMHEFLGDQRIVANDNTGTMDETFGNKGTWYDIGFGLAKVVGHNSYAYLDVEKSFGNDNDDTYQINGGVQWSF